MTIVNYLPPMPSTDDRELFDDDKPNGYLESDRDWAARNHEAINWFIDNHKDIRKIVDFHNEKYENIASGRKDVSVQLFSIPVSQPVVYYKTDTAGEIGLLACKCGGRPIWNLCNTPHSIYCECCDDVRFQCETEAETAREWNKAAK